MIREYPSIPDSPKVFYSKRLEVLQSEKDFLARRDKNYEISRFILFFGGIGLFLFLILEKSNFSFLSLLPSLGFYLIVVKKNSSIRDMLEEKIRGIALIKMELNALEGDYSSFPDGKAYIDPHHDYSSDLDIFGERSLFQYFNRTLSSRGEDRLSEWFLKPSSPEEIRERQDAIRELIGKPEWMQDFRNIKISERTRPEYLKSFFSWLSKPSEIPFPKILLYWVRFSPWVMGSLGLILLLNFVFPELQWDHDLYYKPLPEILGIGFLLNLLWVGRYTKRIQKIHQVLSGQSATLFSYAAMIEKMENESFSTPLISRIQGSLNTEPKASFALNYLSKILKSFDQRMNILVSIFTNGLFLSDIRLVGKLESWKNTYQKLTPVWIDSIIEMEALLSLSILGFNETSWNFPELVNDPQFLESREMGHPLIALSKRINNDFSLVPPHQLMLITGSNMAGKSTFLRTIGVNLILAQMGSKVCAQSFTFAPVPIYTSLRIVDSLQENTSSFYAELKRLEALVQRSQNGENIFFLLDEILRGTNSNDRHMGSKAVIKHLIRHHTFGILATHDLSLGEMVSDFPREIRNMHFDVSVKNDELFFDYTLKPGICTSLNASILMRKIGLDMDS